MNAPVTADDLVEVFTIERLCRAYSLGRSKVYEAIKAKELRALKLGARTLVRRRDIEAWLDQLPELQTA